MSGIGDSLADLDKQVNKSVPGGWVTIGGLALGGAGAAGAFSGLGAGAAGAGAGAGGLSASAVPSLAGGLALGGEAAAAGSSLGAAGGLGAGAAGAGGFGIAAPVAGSTFGALSAGAAPVAGAALTPAAAMAVPGSAEAIYAAQTASSAAGAGNPFGISPMQAMMASRMVGGGLGQQQGGGQQSSSVGFKPGQPINSADPILALLAPKMKKKERISLL